MSNQRILINCLLLSQCSGGYKSYFKNVIIPLTNNLNLQGVKTKMLIPLDVKENYTTLLDKNHIIWDNSGKTGLKRVLYEKKQIPILVKKYKFKTVYTPYQIGPAVLKGAVSVLMFRNMQPYMASKYNYSFKNRLKSWLVKKFTNYHLRKASFVIAISNFTKEVIINKENVKPEKVKIIPHGIELQNSLNHSDKKNFILTVGSILPYRRLEDVLGAYEIFMSKNKQTDLKLIIAGGGNDIKYTNKIKKLILKSNFKESIKMTGSLSHEKVISLFEQCKMFVMSSEIEACPNTALEAMSMGCTIISSTNPPMPEFFKNSALYYSFRNKKKLANQMDLLYFDENKRKELSDLASERVKEFSWDICISKTEKLLKNIS